DAAAEGDRRPPRHREEWRCDHRPHEQAGLRFGGGTRDRSRPADSAGLPVRQAGRADAGADPELTANARRCAASPRRCQRTAETTMATAAVSFFAYGTCRNSFGPVAFDF